MEFTTQQILTIIKQSHYAGSKPPTHRIFAERLGIAIATVNRHIGLLESEGYIKREGKGRNWGGGRNIKLVEKSPSL